MQALGAESRCGQTDTACQDYGEGKLHITKPMDFEGGTSEARGSPETSCNQPFAAFKDQDLIWLRNSLVHRIVAAHRSAAVDLEGGQAC